MRKSVVLTSRLAFSEFGPEPLDPGVTVELLAADAASLVDRGLAVAAEEPTEDEGEAPKPARRGKAR